MIEVVRIKEASISVRDDKTEGLSICLKCKGFKTIAVWRHWEPWFWLGYEGCPVCDGRGLFWGGRE